VNQLPTNTNDATATPDADTAPLSKTALESFAVPFTNANDLPEVAILLLDVGEEAGGLDPSTISTIAVPVTIAIDPLRPDAAARAAAYRKAGFEVAILADAEPKDSTASDLEVAYQGAREVVPEAVAWVAGPDAPFQTDRAAAQHAVALVKPDGLGLVTAASGLNPARQLAESEAVAYAQMTPIADDTDAATIKRALDRAAFDATQTGQVVVALRSVPSAVTALLGWTSDPPDGIVYAPVSAILKASLPAPVAPEKMATQPGEDDTGTPAKRELKPEIRKHYGAKATN
jgi:polysaccharide deacetylase 2 family uncharacterized protein YibQ